MNNQNDRLNKLTASVHGNHQSIIGQNTSSAFMGQSKMDQTPKTQLNMNNQYNAGRVMNVQKNVFSICPAHENYEITNICTMPNCLEPLCPECITVHLKIHEQNQTRFSIEPIQTVRQEKLDEIVNLHQLAIANRDQLNNKNYQKEENFINGKQILEQQRLKMINVINQYFAGLNAKLEQQITMQHTLQSEQIKLEQNKNKLADRIEKLVFDLEKSQNKLTSPDYIKHLLLLMHDDNKEIYEIIRQEVDEQIRIYKKIEVDVEGDESILYTMAESVLQKYCTIEDYDNNIVVTQNNNPQQNFSYYLPQYAQISAHQPGFSTTNNNNSNNNQYGNQAMSHLSQNNQYKYNIEQSNYFNRDTNQKLLVYFQENSKQLHYIDLEETEKNNSEHFRFNTVQLNCNLKVPLYSRTIVTSTNKVFLLGGLDGENKSVLSFVYQLDLRNRLLVNQSQMITGRHSFGCCVVNDCIYVLGGIDQQNQMTASFEKYDIYQNSWTVIQTGLQPTINSQLASFCNRFIFNIHSRGIERYEISSNQWTSMGVPGNIQLNNLTGCVQINSTELMLMGGIDENTRKSQQVYLLSQLVTNNIHVQTAGSLPYGGPVMYQPVMHDGVLFVMVNSICEKSKQLLAIAKDRAWETL